MSLTSCILFKSFLLYLVCCRASDPICRVRGWNRHQQVFRVTLTWADEVCPGHERRGGLHWLQDGWESHTSLCSCLHTAEKTDDIFFFLSFLFIGDEGGETEDLDQPTLKLQPFLAKAERSHLIVWQIMVNEEWPSSSVIHPKEAHLTVLPLCSCFALRYFNHQLVVFCFSNG